MMRDIKTSIVCWCVALKKEKRKDLDWSDKDILEHCISPLCVRGSETEGGTPGFLTAFFGVRDAFGVIQEAQYLYFFQKKRDALQGMHL
ncbi:MAG: hypothetical protein F4175_08565 [Gemmatimonadetes bacterium]|nr:hypothetical protein [Gemmatimonadota bacterium]